jgi:hypothetical protein
MNYTIPQYLRLLHKLCDGCHIYTATTAPVGAVTLYVSTQRSVITAVIKGYVRGKVYIEHYSPLGALLLFFSP